MTTANVRAELERMPIGTSRGINGHIVGRWNTNAFEVDAPRSHYEYVDLQKAAERIAGSK